MLLKSWKKTNTKEKCLTVNLALKRLSNKKREEFFLSHNSLKLKTFIEELVKYACVTSAVFLKKLDIDIVLKRSKDYYCD